MRGLANEDAQKNVPLGKTDYQAGDFSGDTKTTLDLEDDAAFCNWGGAWRMPEKGDFDNLLTSTTKDDFDATLGVLTINETSLQFLAAGYGSGAKLGDAGSGGSYWSSSLNSVSRIYAYCLSFSSDGVNSSDLYTRCRGRSVRPFSE